MNLFIAAGGKGRRLGHHLAKSLVPVDGQPIIDRIIAAGRLAGFSRIFMGVDEGKEALLHHVHGQIEAVYGSVEPLTSSFFAAAQSSSASIIVGVNGDTLWQASSARALVTRLEEHTTADAAVLLTTVCRSSPLSSTYWRYPSESGRVVALEEVPCHQIATEFIMVACRRSGLERLSHSWTERYRDLQQLPFRCYSLGWDYLVRLLLWREQHVIAEVGDDLSLNINTPADLALGTAFLRDPAHFRALVRMPIGSHD